MSKRILRAYELIPLVAVATFLALASAGVVNPASAQAVQFSVNSQGALTNTQLAAIERAVSFQIDHQVSRYWPGAVASFGPNGIPINIISMKTMADTCGTADVGCHLAFNVRDCDACAWQMESAWIYVGETTFQETAITIDHEVTETVEDPTGDGEEICDPVETLSYWGVGHVRLSDFVTPAYFAHPHVGRLDYLGDFG